MKIHIIPDIEGTNSGRTGGIMPEITGRIVDMGQKEKNLKGKLKKNH